MSNNFFPDQNIKELFSEGDVYDIAKNIQGKIFREAANRVTKEFTYNGVSYFIKFHEGIGWAEVFKNLLKIRLPTVGAKTEWKAINRLKELGIDCPEVAAVCYKGINPANSQSFIVTKSLVNTISLEDALKQKKFQALGAQIKREFIKKIAKISKKMHDGGMNHRDFYLCHFHVDADLDVKKDIYLIDLHRAQIRRYVPKRWLEKDIGGLIHSALGFNFSERDLYRFLTSYFNLSLSEILNKKSNFFKKSTTRALAMHMKPILEEINIRSKKVLAQDSLYKKGLGSGYRWIGLKGSLNVSILGVLEDLDAAMLKGNIIKQEKGHFIVSMNLEGREIFIKKYQIKNKWHLLRRIFKKSRANTSWIAIHWLRAVKISTVKPIVIYERLNSLFVLEAYLITERIEGEILTESSQNHNKDFIIAARIQAFFKRLRWINFYHGDAKTSNFFLNEEDLIVFDLDIASKQFSAFISKRKIKKDLKRILRSTKDNRKLNSLILKRVTN